MAIVTKGPMLGFSGTVDGITYSQQPNGTTVAKRKNGKSKKKPTPKQISVRKDTKIFAEFLKPLKQIVLVGYELESKSLGLNPNNAMVKCTRKNAMQGVYPNRSVDSSKILVTKGSLPAADATAVTMTEKGLAFTWSTELISKITRHTDQVMMIAHFPKLKESKFITAGAERHTGKDLLLLNGIKRGNEAEVYISFVTTDRRNISSSIYLGRFIW